MSEDFHKVTQVRVLSELYRRDEPEATDRIEMPK